MTRPLLLIGLLLAGTGSAGGEPTWLEARVTIASGQGRAGAAGVVHARPSSFQRSARLRAWSWGKEAQASPTGE